MPSSLPVQLLHMLPPECAHDVAIAALRLQLAPSLKTPIYENLNTSLWGREFTNPIGLAAGFDKNATCIPALLRQGFGFIEVGTVTLLPQAGNPKPRLFRLTEDKAIINRMGFNNKGIEEFTTKLAKRQGGIVGVNIGKNKTSLDPHYDYKALLRKVYLLSDYITINISSPNTPGLRALQGAEELDKLLAVIGEERAELVTHYGKKVPIVVKIAPDINEKEAASIAQVVLMHGIDGLIISNTTIGKREMLQSTHKNETGGLSGKPLLALSTERLKDMYRLTKGKVPLIGTGGIFSGEDAYHKIRAGASLVQIYTAFIYEGFGITGKIAAELSALLKRDGFAQLRDAVGVDAK